MGCASSADNTVQTAATRRRLSVGHVEATTEVNNDAVAEDDRGLMTALNANSILELLKDGSTEGKRFSISSMTDQAKTSFANKSIGHMGDEVDPVRLGLGYTCRKGLKPESPNQDSWMVLSVDTSFTMYGVFDGHGSKGHDVSQYVKETLPKLIIKDSRFKTDEMPAMLVDSFKKVQNLVSTADRLKKLEAKMSGTTCTICIHDHVENKITVAHVADSTCVLGSFKDPNKRDAMVGIALTRDHKPNLKDERARIEKAGGRVVFDGYTNHRVYAKNGRYPGLNMSRCLGDLMGHADAGCSCEPEVLERKLQPEDHILLLCSDGVWEFISPQEAVDIVGSAKPGQCMVSADKLAKESWDRWIREEGGSVVDDITVILVHLQQAKKSQP